MDKPEWYKPGDIVQSYGGRYDVVLAAWDGTGERPGWADNWMSRAVLVQAILRDGRTDPEYPHHRVHCTPPDGRTTTPATRSVALARIETLADQLWQAYSARDWDRADLIRAEAAAIEARLDAVDATQPTGGAS